ERFKQEGKIKVGEPVFEIQDPKKALGSACKRLKFQHFSSRALRRCFITRAIELGVDFKTISAWQGHQDGGVLIAKTYSHLRNEHSDNMAKKLVARALLSRATIQVIMRKLIVISAAAVAAVCSGIGFQPPGPQQRRDAIRPRHASP